MGVLNAGEERGGNETCPPVLRTRGQRSFVRFGEVGGGGFASPKMMSECAVSIDECELDLCLEFGDTCTSLKVLAGPAQCVNFLHDSDSDHRCMLAPQADRVDTRKQFQPIIRVKRP